MGHSPLVVNFHNLDPVVVRDSCAPVVASISRSLTIDFLWIMLCTHVYLRAPVHVCVLYTLPLTLLEVVGDPAVSLYFSRPPAPRKGSKGEVTGLFVDYRWA